jgi:hypothetical protein
VRIWGGSDTSATQGNILNFSVEYDRKICNKVLRRCEIFIFLSFWRWQLMKSWSQTCGILYVNSYKHGDGEKRWGRVLVSSYKCKYSQILNTYCTVLYCIVLGHLDWNSWKEFHVIISTPNFLLSLPKPSPLLKFCINCHSQSLPVFTCLVCFMKIRHQQFRCSADTGTPRFPLYLRRPIFWSEEPG